VTLKRRLQVQETRRTSDHAILRGGDIPFSRGLARSRVERAACGGLNRISGGYWRMIQGWLWAGSWGQERNGICSRS